MKYEMVFGDDWLFFDAQKDCEMVGNGHHKVENGKLMVWNFSEKYWAESHTNTITISAMRRIIRTPIWTVEDQKAGMLPEVGCAVIVSPNCKATVTAVDSIQKVVSVQCENQALDILSIHEMLPIESPEEKAARLRGEWCRKCTSKFYPRGRDSFPERIYDALLSGDLPVPGEGEQ